MYVPGFFMTIYPPAAPARGPDEVRRADHTKETATMITPSNGRIVWYTPARPTGDFDSDKAIVQHDKLKPLAAMVVHVWGDRMVNLIVFDSNGMPTPRTSVTLLQDDDAKPESGRFCSWMPYQIGQAAKAAAV
jgi:hypothetical protein